MRKKIFQKNFLAIVLIIVLALVSSCKNDDENKIIEDLVVCTADTYEPNNTIDVSYVLDNIEETSGSYTANISSENDVDFYSIRALEAMHLGFPGTAQYFKMSFQLTNPAAMDYDLYIYNEAGTLIDQSTTRGNDAESIEVTWEGTVGYDDSYTFFVEVRPYTGNWDCADYTLSAMMSYSTDPW